MQFYQKLSELRKSAGLSQEELATKVGVSRQTVFKWESGLSSPSMDNILVLCRLFSVSADELIGNTPPKETKEEIQAVPVFSVYRFRYEYKSKRTLWGLPLVHIHIGFGFCKAKGIIAIGNIACGLISVGGLALGLLSIGGFALGLLVLAGAAAGGFAVGGLALGAFAVGGLAVGFIAVGGAAIGVYSLGGAAIAANIAASSGNGYAHAPLGVSDGVPSGSYTRLVSDFGELLQATKELFPSTPRWILELMSSIL